MKKTILALIVLFWTLFVNAQMPVNGGSTLCISPLCQPIKCLTTDTVVLAFGLTTSDGFKAINYTQASGPSKAVIGPVSTVWASGLAGSSTVKIWGFTPGSYTFQAIGTSTSGGVSAPAIDSVIVSAPVVAPVTPYIIRVVTTYSNQGMPGVTQTFYSDGTIK